MEHSLKQETLWHGINNNLISNLNSRLWLFDPKTTLLNYSHEKKKKLFSNLLGEFDILAFSDGACDKGSSKGGIGGYIVSNSRSLLYVFSGPCSASNSIQTEIVACTHISQVLGVACKEKQCVICIDSKIVLEKVLQLKAGIEAESI